MPFKSYNIESLRMETLAPLQAKILALINQHRTSNALPPLTGLSQINEIAMAHSKAMASGKVGIGHDGFQQRAAQVMTLLDAITVAENVAYGQETAELLVQSWLDSTGHRQNIEGAYTHTGIGIVQDSEGRNVFTQIFAALEEGTMTNEVEMTDDYLAVELLHFINDYRQENKTNALQSHIDVVQAAKRHSERMAQGKIALGYDGLKEELMTLAKNLGARAVAANIAQSRPNPEKILDTWLNSPAHCKNIEGDFTTTGIGVAHNEKGEYFITQLFILN